MADRKSSDQKINDLNAKLMTEGTELTKAKESQAALAKKLTDGKIIDKPEDLGKGVDKLLKDVADAKANQDAQVALAKKLTDDKIIDKPEDLGKGIDKLLADRKDSADKLTKAETDLKTRTKELDDAKKFSGDLAKKLSLDKPEDLDKGIDTLLADNKKLQADRKEDAKMIDTLDKQVKAQQKEVADREALLKKVKDELVDSKYLDPKDDLAALGRGVKAALDLAKMKDPVGEVRDLRKQKDVLQERLTREVAEAKADKDKEVAKLNDEHKKMVEEFKVERDKETAALKTQLKQRRTPEEVLGVLLPVVENGNREQSQRAQLDVGAVLGDPMASPALKAQAKVVQGLAFRNADKFAEAKMVLTDALKELPEDAREWRAAAQEGLKDVSNPAGYFSTRIDESMNRNEPKQALTMLDRGIKALGDSNAPMLAERSLLLLEQARARSQDGKVSPADPALAQALKDAEEAISKTKDKPEQKMTLALACYARGRSLEARGDDADARDSYTEAIKEHPTADQAGSRYRGALARLLLKPRQGKPPLMPPAVPPPVPPAKEMKEPDKDKKEGDKVGQLPTLDEVRRLAANPETAEQARAALLVLLTVSLQVPPPQPPGKAEAIKLADEIIRQYEMNPKSVSFDVLADAYAIKGMWTQALMTYANGLKPYLRAEYHAGLMDLLQKHPAIRRPASLEVANPFEAATQYGQGLRYYFARDYVEAEKHLKAATEFDNLDARYFYFLGLSRLMQGKADAAEDFVQGARLEKDNRPSSKDVSISLERVQGPARRVLNEARKAVR